jgi:hypothetical protein
MQIQFQINSRSFFYRLCLPIVIMFFSVAMIMAVSLFFEQPLTKSHQGMLDLSEWNTDEQIKTHLNGEWAFIWDELIAPDQATLKTIERSAYFLDLPSTWNQMHYEGYQLPGQGKATLLLALFPPEGAKDLVLKVPVLTNQFQLWIDGVLKVKTSDFGSSFAPRSDSERIQYVSFSANEVNPLQPIILMFHLINNRHRDGGMWEALSITSLKNRVALYDTSMMLELGISILLTIISLFLFVNAARSQQISLLYLALFTSLMAIRGVTVNERLFFTFFAIQEWQTQQVIEYLTIYASVPFFALYLGNRFPRYFPPLMHWLTAAICGSLMLLVVLTPAKVFSYSAPIFHLVVLLYIFLWLGTMSEQIQKKEKGSVLLFCGGILFITANINDILFTNNIINTTNLAHVGALVFIIFAFLSRRVIEESEQFNRSQLSNVLNKPFIDETSSSDSNAHHPLAIVLQQKAGDVERYKKEACVEALNYALRLWEQVTDKDKLALAEESKLWRITNDGGTLKTRTLDKYLKLSQLPKNPRYSTVAKTLRFIAMIDGISENDGYWLQEVAKKIH